MRASDALQELQRKANKMTADEANFEKGTWTFKAPWFACSPGEFLIIPLGDWNDMKMRAESEPVTTTKGE